MVYNGTGCGLNASLWAPHFGLPYVTHTTRSLMPGYCQCDLDVGDMFLNFLLHEDLKRMSGVDVRYVRSRTLPTQIGRLPVRDCGSDGRAIGWN